MSKLLKENFDFFVGIDISKKTFDVGIMCDEGIKVSHKSFTNNAAGFEAFLVWTWSKTNSNNILFCMEHTGIYSRGLWFYLQDHDCKLWVESGYVIKSKSGIVKGKNDKKDSYLIADYALSNKKRVKLTPSYDKEIIKLHDLMTNRNRLIDSINLLEVPLKEMESAGHLETYQMLKDVNEQALIGLKKSIKILEKKINELIESNPSWQENLKLAQSVKGVGKIVSLYMLIYTRNFNEDSTARKFASLAGLAPFVNESGTSVRKGTHVSHFSNKFLNALLHSAAMAAIRSNKQIKVYFKRKKSEGKKGFIPMNNVKNKIVQIVFACIRSKQEFKNDFIHQKAA